MPLCCFVEFFGTFFKIIFLERLYDNLTEKYGWHFFWRPFWIFGGHFDFSIQIIYFSLYLGQ